MFRYNSDTQTYSMSLFADRTPEEGFSALEEKHKQMQEVALRSTFRIIVEPEFHDLWFCETRDCENSFWLGGRHHCRMCGNTVCEEHCHTNVVLSTHLMPVIEDKLPNVTAPILAASRLDAPLPETLEFKRACLACCEKAKHVPLKQWIEQEKERIRRERKEAQDRERLGESHWTADEELTAKIHAMKVKKIAWCRTNARRHKRQQRGEPIYDSEGEEFFPDDGGISHKPLAQQIAERAEYRLQAARAAQEAALQATAERQAQLAAHEDLLHTQREETMTPAELALYRKKRERAKAEAAKNAIANQVNSANEQMKTGMASVFFSIAKRAEIAAQQEQLHKITADAQVALSKSTRHIFDRLTLNKEFERAKASGDETAMHVVAVALIGLAWQAKVDRRRRAVLKEQREALLRTVSLGRLQAWWRVMLAKLRALHVKQLKLNLQASDQEIARMRVLDLMQAHRMDGIKSLLFKLLGLVRMKLKLAAVPRVLVVDAIECTAPASSQRVIVHLQSGLSNLSTVHSTGRTALLHKSKTECVYHSRSIGALADGAFSEKCVLAQVTGKSVLGVTLVNTDSFTQNLIQLDKYPTLLNGETITIRSPAVENTVCPVLHPTTHKSYLPASNYSKSTKNNKKLAALPAVRTFRMCMLPVAFTHTGRVQKQANSLIGEFKSRFLVLAEGKLLYYDDPNVLHKPRGVMSCESVSVFAFGPDRTPQGELTMYISDSTQHWYLRFPKSIGSSGISTWLRKIQYNCMQVSINNTTKGFVERIEQMSKVYTYPVLRPIVKMNNKPGVFDSATPTTSGRIRFSMRYSSFSARDSSGSRGSVGRDSMNRTPSSRGIVFGNSTSSRVPWVNYITGRSSTSASGVSGVDGGVGGDRHSVGTSNDSIVHGRIITSTSAHSTNEENTTPASPAPHDTDGEYARTASHTPILTTFSAGTGKYRSPIQYVDDEEKSDDCSIIHNPDTYDTTTHATSHVNTTFDATHDTTHDATLDTTQISNASSSDDSYVLSPPYNTNTATITTTMATATVGAADKTSTHTNRSHDVDVTTNNTNVNNAIDAIATTTIVTTADGASPKTTINASSDYSVEHKHSPENSSAVNTAPAVALSNVDVVARSTTPTAPLTSDIIKPISTKLYTPPAKYFTIASSTTAFHTSPQHQPRSPGSLHSTSSNSINTTNNATNNTFTLYQPRGHNPLSSQKRRSSAGRLNHIDLAVSAYDVSSVSASGFAAISGSGSSGSGADRGASEDVSGSGANAVGDAVVSSNFDNTSGDVAEIPPTAGSIDATANAPTTTDPTSQINAALDNTNTLNKAEEEVVQWSDSEDELSSVNIHNVYSVLPSTGASASARVSTTNAINNSGTVTHDSTMQSLAESPRVIAVPVAESSAVSAKLLTHTTAISTATITATVDDTQGSDSAPTAPSTFTTSTVHDASSGIDAPIMDRITNTTTPSTPLTIITMESEHDDGSVRTNNTNTTSTPVVSSATAKKTNKKKKKSKK